jgi:hypothetical protein
MNTLAGLIGGGASIDDLFARLRDEGHIPEHEFPGILCKVMVNTLADNTNNFRNQLVRHL